MTNTVKIPFTLPATRKDDTPLAAADVARVDVEISSDNGQTWVSVGHTDAAGSPFVVSDLDTDVPYLFRAFVTDKQNPPLTSDFSAPVSVRIPPPVLAAPNAPTLGTPVIG